MFKKENSNFFQASDGTRIFYSLNFDPKSYDPSIPLLVFNYGLVCNNAHWKDQVDYFDSKYQILTHDYRGHHNSSGQDDISHCTFLNIAQDINELLSKLSFTNIFMLGHSMGVNITLEFARRYNKGLLGLVLISGTVLPPQDVMFDSAIVDIVTPYLESFTKNYPSLFRSFWKSAYLNPLAKRIVHNGGFNTKKVPQEFVRHYLKKIGELPEDIFFHMMRQMRDHDIINHLDEIKTPSLIIGGDRDKVIPNYQQILLHKNLENSSLYILKDGSHVPQADFPELINTRIEKFINDNKSI